MKFKSLAKRKGWGADQLTVQLLTLIDVDLLREVERIASESSEKGHTFEDFYLQRCSARLREPAQMYAKLPQDAQTILEN
ncbi:unnamed protein product [Peronospora farinosa]|uniref:Uncharacterized protein n=1 Tax=Peronospora farinosa TaxID=134698 RepID=A0AAV0SR94_9STRA|nr:unnamed protein product [Peronospora farinosa]